MEICITHHEPRVTRHDIIMIDINFLKDLTVESGKIALTYFGRVTPCEKPDKTPVTEADLFLDKFITDKIREKYPSHIILSEEMSGKPVLKTDHVIWAVDPVDGTASFSSGLPVWGISIGVLVNYIPLYGAFYMPVTGELYYSDGKHSYSGEQKLNISHAGIDENSFLAVPSYAHRAFDLRKFPGKTRSMGSIAAHMCYVARNAAIGAIMRGHIWDIAAGWAICRTAGGKMAFMDKTEIDWHELCSCDKAKKEALLSGKDNFEDLFRVVTENNKK